MTGSTRSWLKTARFGGCPTSLRACSSEVASDGTTLTAALEPVTTRWLATGVLVWKPVWTPL